MITPVEMGPTHLFDPRGDYPCPECSVTPDNACTSGRRAPPEGGRSSNFYNAPRPGILWDTLDDEPLPEDGGMKRPRRAETSETESPSRGRASRTKYKTGRLPLEG